MCGIVGYVGACEAAPILLSGLSRLEYRGYDSSGVAVCGADGCVEIVKAQGPLDTLVRLTDGGHMLSGTCGIGHTRWATHGKPDAINAHPHASAGKRVVLVHNGIIENHRVLRDALMQEGYEFISQTDTETAVMLLDSCYARASGLPPRERALQAIGEMMRRLQGSYAMAMLFADQPDAVYAARLGSPLVAARCENGGHLLASDIQAVIGHAREVLCLEDMEIARLDRDGMQVYNRQREPVQRTMQKISWNADAAGKDGYAHFMLKEIMEQPRAVRDTVSPRIRESQGAYAADLVDTGLTDEALRSAARICLIGCGSAYHAALAGKMIIERLAQIPCTCDTASEFRYGASPQTEDTLAVIISQSGETADSLAALRLCRARGVRTLAVVNVVASSIAREADMVLYTYAGPEISVATTKAYAAQLAALNLLAVALADSRKTISQGEKQALLGELLALPEKISSVLNARPQVLRFARAFKGRSHAFYIGRGIDYAACMEGSLKLKETSYIHAEAYPAGELKHGAISLVEKGMPVICAATQEHVLDKTISNMEEARARGASVLAVTMEGLPGCAEAADDVIAVPRTHPLFTPLLVAPVMQLLAYDVSCERGLDVDKPRNLAKSVTVE